MRIKPWKECGEPGEYEEALREAFRQAHGSVKAAARLLQMDRSYLYDCLKIYGDPRVAQPNTDNEANAVGKPNSVGLPNTPHTVGPVGLDDRVGTSPYKSLRYRHDPPSFGGVSSAAPAAATGTKASLTVEIGDSYKTWLQFESIREQGRSGRKHPSMAAVIEQMIDRERNGDPK